MSILTTSKSFDITTYVINYLPIQFFLTTQHDLTNVFKMSNVSVNSRGGHSPPPPPGQTPGPLTFTKKKKWPNAPYVNSLYRQMPDRLGPHKASNTSPSVQEAISIEVKRLSRELLQKPFPALEAVVMKSSFLFFLIWNVYVKFASMVIPGFT